MFTLLHYSTNIWLSDEKVRILSFYVTLYCKRQDNETFGSCMIYTRGKLLLPFLVEHDFSFDMKYLDNMIIKKTKENHLILNSTKNNINIVLCALQLCCLTYSIFLSLRYHVHRLKHSSLQKYCAHF